jgi:hypothetical protein
VARPARADAGKVAERAEANPAAPAPALQRSGTAAAPEVTLSARATPEAAELRFAWSRAVPAAVFEHAGTLWALFAADDAGVQGWGDLAAPGLASWLTPVASEQAHGLRLFRLALRRPVEIRVEGSGTVWRVRLMLPGAAPATAATAVLARDLATGTLGAAASGPVVETVDPLTGERLGVLLDTVPGLRQPTRLRLVDLELLATAQGLVWRPLADGVVAAVDGGRFTLSRPGGLRLSPESGGEPPQARSDLTSDDGFGRDADHRTPVSVPSEAMQPAAGPAVAPLESAPASLLGLMALEGTDARGRQELRRELLERLPQLSGLPEALARLELARLALADALGPEAQAALTLLKPADLPDPAAEAVQRSRAAMSGAAAVLDGEPEAALAVLSDPGLDGDPEAPLWRVLAAAQAGRWDRAAETWARSGALLYRYPLPLRRSLGPRLATALIDHSQSEEALAVLGSLRPLEPEPLARARLELLLAKALVDAGRADDAAEPLRAAAADGNRTTRIEAAFLAVRSRQEQGELLAAAARDALLQQRPYWRGHPEAGRMLRHLARLQQETGDGLAALATLRTALEEVLDATMAEEARAELRRQVAAMLQTQGPGRLSAVAAAALYYSHRDLLAGSDALPTEVRLDLAARAAGAGLLETASGLLQEMGSEGTGPAASRAVLALAEAEADAGNLTAALARLEAADRSDREVAHRIALARARAELRAGNAGAALAALRGAAPDEEAERLRLAAFVALGDWQALARSCETILGGQEDEAGLAPERAETVVWLALARARLGQADAAAALARRYADRLPQEGSWRPLLAMIAAPPLPTDGPERLAAAAGELAATMRVQLGLLPPLGEDGPPHAGGGDPPALRTAPGR